LPARLIRYRFEVGHALEAFEVSPEDKYSLCNRMHALAADPRGQKALISRSPYRKFARNVIPTAGFSQIVNTFVISKIDLVAASSQGAKWDS